MKRSGKRFFAVILCLAMALSLLPMSALARWDDDAMPAVPAAQDGKSSAQAGLPAAPEGGEQAALSAEGPDGALEDSWVQIEASKRGTPIAPWVEDGQRVLSATSSNSNNLDDGNPAIFVDTTMNKVLNALDGSAEKTLSFTLTPSSSGTWMGFALMLRYNGETGANAKAYHIGYPSGPSTGWFTQNYGASSVTYPGFDGPNMAANTPVDFEIKWSDTGISSFKINGEAKTLGSNCTLDSVPAVTADTDGLVGVAFKVGTSGGSATTLHLSNVTYTGQADTTTVQTVTGTVSAGGNKVGNVAVTLEQKSGDVVVAKYTDTTDAQGVYTMENVVGGDYTVTVDDSNYTTYTNTVTVASQTVRYDITLTAKSEYHLPTDGVTEDTWQRDTAADTAAGKTPSGAICEKTDDGVHLKSASNDKNSHSTSATSDWPGIYLNATANEKLAAVPANKNRWIEFTYVRAAGSNPRFGVILNYTDPGNGFFIGCNGESGWFWEDYSGSWSSGSGTTPAAGVETKVYVEWNASKVVSFKVNGDAVYTDLPIAAPSSGGTQGTGVGFRLNTFNSEPAAEYYIKEMHYSGQREITAYPLTVTVQDTNGPVTGATVTAKDGKYVAKEFEDGKYRLILPENEEVTVNVTMAGYTPYSEAVTMTAAASKTVTLVKEPVVSGIVTEDRSDPAVTIQGATVTLTSGSGDSAVTRTGVTDENGAYSISVPAGKTYTLTVSATGYDVKTENVTVTAGDVLQDVALTENLDAYHVLEGDGMKVLVSKTFPQVVEYRLNDGKRMDGQKTPLTTIKINKVDANLGTITSVCTDNKTVTYTIPMTAPVAATMTARITVDTALEEMKPNDAESKFKGQTLGFFIDDVDYANDDRLTNPVKSIEIPNHSLVSVNSTQPGAKMTGGKAFNTSVADNDETYTAELNKTLNRESRYFAAFISNDYVAAGISTNTSLDGGEALNVKADYHKIIFKSDGENVTISLQSTAWPYDYLLSDSNPGGLDHTDDLTAEQKVIDPDRREQPYVKVVIASGDQNGDGAVDWQDSAIASRETIMHIPNNSETVKDRVNTRIALNFGSQAQNPFLTSLDNAKRVAAHTDGLGQAILLKGYANEGHDSGHPDYWDMGTRMGGAQDFKTMLAEGKKIGAYFGIHVNAGELYAEAKALDWANERDKLIYYRPDGRVKWGWHWHDTAISFKSLYDLGTGNRAARFQKLADLGGSDLEFIYVDIWGNATGGTDDSWQTRQLSNEITQLVNKGQWRIAHEWSQANVVNSTLQHWTTDFGYGNYEHKGRLNSTVLRFLLNQYKDSFPPDFASYGGACNAPLLGGPAMQGFEGWQGDGEYDLSIYNTFNQMVPTKFLQHYGITNWNTSNTAVKMPYNRDGNDGAPRSNSTTADWKPELQIKLADGEDEVVVTRGTSLSGELMDLSGMDTVDGFLARETEYRSRTITLNGKVILVGAPASAGEDNTFPAEQATLEYLIPWYWNADGSDVTAENEKLYYWKGTAASGRSQWDLPDGWEGLSTVILYELSDQGRGEAQTVTVSGGKVTLSGLKTNTPYVVVKGANAAAITIDKNAPGQHLADPSFNDAKLSAWKVSGDGRAAKINSVKGISVLKLDGEVAVSQKLNDMTPNTKYAAYVAVENRGDEKAYIKVTDDAGNELAYNYTNRSTAVNYISGDSLNNRHGVEAGGSYMQNMYVFFTMPTSGGVTLTLGREDGAGNVYFDAVRVVETQMEGYTYDKDGNITGLTQDFEHSVQGEWPFVVGPVEGVADNRQHLAEKNAPFTQSGWNIKELDDAIDGNWSLKTHGIEGNGNLVYRTIPQNFRFEPGKTYTVSFDYEMGMENLMQVVVGDGAWSGVGNCQTIPLEMAKGAGFKGYPAGTEKVREGVRVDGYGVVTDEGTVKELAYNFPAGTGAKTCTFTVVGSESGETWIGIATAGASLTYDQYYLADQTTGALLKNNEGKPSGKVQQNQGIPDKDGYGLYFSGRGDFILDNLKITTSAVDKSELNDLVTTANGMDQASYTKADTYSGTEEAAWNAFVAARTSAQKTLDDPKATQSKVNSEKTKLENAIKNLKKVEVVISGTVTGEDGTTAVAGATVTLENEEYRPVGLVATTDSQGKFSFTETDDVALSVADYQVKVQATGYQVNTFPVTGLTKTAPTADVTCPLVAEAPGAYVNDFNNGDVSMLRMLESQNNGNVTAVAEKGMAKITFHSDNREDTDFIDENIQMQNGIVSVDITPLSNPQRFGLDLRATNNTNRIFIGTNSGLDKWLYNCWNGSGEGYNIVDYSGLKMEVGVTRTLRVKLDGTKVSIYVDGVPVVENETMISCPTGTGYVGFNARYQNGSSYLIDNLRVESADTVAGKYTVEGVVKTGETPLAGATVSILQNDTLVTSTTSNANGAYKTQPLDPGTYTVKVTAPNYSEATGTVTITNANITEDQDFTLTVDKSALETLYDEKKDTSKTDNDRNAYSDESFEALTKALAAAKTVLDDDNATAAQIGAAKLALEEAVDGLTVVKTAYGDLRDLVDDCKALKESDYNTQADSWTTFQEKLAAADAVLEDDEALQTEVDAAKDALQEAFEALEIVPAGNLEGLNEAIEAAEAVKNENYTDASWQAFQDALTAAKEIAEDETDPFPYTQTQVDAATKALTDAQAALEKKPSQSTGGGTPSETVKTETKPDGTKVTTVTKPDGTVTETAEKPDGTTEVVETKKDGTVTETVTDPEGAKTEKVTTPDKAVTITATDPEGEELAKIELPAEIPEPETPFVDVDGVVWAKEAINNVAGLKLVKGVGDDRYDPITPMTRGSLATVLHRLSQGKTDYETTFKDVAKGQYYTEGVAWAAKVKVVTGYTAEIFAPDDIITREQLAVMLARYAKLIGMDTAVDADVLDEFTDGGKTGPWAVDGVAWAVKNGILRGRGANDLDPTANVTRAEVAVMLDRFIDLIK